MKRKLLIVSILALSLLALLSIGPDTPADDPGPAAQEAPASEAPEAAPSGEPLETFEPTEKLAAESAVSFPVDI